MEYKGVEYTVVQMAGGAGWKWEKKEGNKENRGNKKKTHKKQEELL